MVHQKVETRKKQVYGIVGAKGHGKDTLAKLIKSSGRQGGTFITIHFADALKSLCREVFGLSDYDVNNPVGKEARLPLPIVIDMHLSAMQKITGLNVKPHGAVVQTPRELLQIVGTEYIRAEQGDYWLDQVVPVLTGNQKLLIPDTRFANEAELVRLHGGKIIRVIRIDAEAMGDDHSSETEGTKIIADLTLGVRTGNLSIVERVAHLISKGKWDSAMRYDYGRIQMALALYQANKPLKECVNAIGVKGDDSAAFRCILDYYGVAQRRAGKVSNPHRFEGGVEQKQCSICGEWRNLNFFNKNAKSWDMLHCLCRACASKLHKQKYALYEKCESLDDVERTARQGARLRGLSFNIDRAYLSSLWEQQKGRCFYTKEPMTFTKGEVNKVSVDRLDSSIGYEHGNLVLCCSRVNLMKGPLELTEFRDLIQRLAKYSKEWGGEEDSHSKVDWAHDPLTHGHPI